MVRGILVCAKTEVAHRTITKGIKRINCMKPLNRIKKGGFLDKKETSLDCDPLFKKSQVKNIIIFGCDI
jgi:hypothetical protein